MQYLLVKYKNKYSLIDTLPIQLEVSSRGEYEEIRVTKDNKVYKIYSYEVIDDWYADTGYITHFDKSKQYIGKLIFESNNIEEIALEYANKIYGGKL